MCYTTAFLQLDLSVIVKSIAKVTKYFDEKLSRNDFVYQKSQPLTKAIINQVKDTSVIVDFAKNLHKDSL